MICTPDIASFRPPHSDAVKGVIEGGAKVKVPWIWVDMLKLRR